MTVTLNMKKKICLHGNMLTGQVSGHIYINKIPAAGKLWFSHNQKCQPPVALGDKLEDHHKSLGLIIWERETWLAGGTRYCEESVDQQSQWLHHNSSNSWYFSLDRERESKREKGERTVRERSGREGERKVSERERDSWRSEKQPALIDLFSFRKVPTDVSCCPVTVWKMASVQSRLYCQ